MKNVVLIGMPAAGKSSLGVVLAKALELGFVDTDIIIQQKTSKALQDIINEEGTEKFVNIENKIICDCEFESMVVATGGSVVTEKEAMEHLKKNGIIVYLECSFKTITRRLNNIKTRGIALNKNETLRDIYDKRVPLYKQYADITVDCNTDNFEQVVGTLTETIEKYIV